MKILVTGPQGSGKTTQAELAAKKLGLPVIDIGRILREFAKDTSDDAKAVRETMNKGVLAPDQIVADLMKEKINESGGGFVADGYPRSLSQLELFDPEYNLVFYLQIADEVVRQRLLRRGRADDNPEIIDERLKNYHLLTEPLLEKFKEKGILTVLDGNQPIEQIHEKIWLKLKTNIS